MAQKSPFVIIDTAARLVTIFPAAQVSPIGGFYFARDEGTDGRLYILDMDNLGVKSWKPIVPSAVTAPLITTGRVYAPVLVPTGQNWKILVTNTTPTPPTMPAAPTFSGAVLTVGGGGMHATVSAAVAAAAPGDIIEVLAGNTIVEGATVTINKSLEIRGQNRSTSVIQSTVPVYTLQVSPGTNGVYIHDLTIQNLKPTDTSVEAAIQAQTVNTANPNGSTGLYFKSLNIVHPEFGIVVGGNGWVIDDCQFDYTPAPGAGDTHRHIGDYQTVGNCFINACTFVCTPEATPRTIPILLTNIQYDFITPATTGHTGNIVVSNNVQGGGNMRQFFVQEWFKQPGLNAAPITLGAFSLWSFNNTHGTTSGGSHIFNEGSTLVSPMSFFNIVYLSNDTCGADGGKGLLAIDGSGGPGRLVGTPAGGLWAPSTNTIGDPIVGPTWADASTLANLVGFRTTVFATPVPLIPVATPTSQAPPENAAIVSPTQGAIVAQSALSGPGYDVFELTEQTGSDAMNPVNLVLIRSASTGQRLTSGGKQIYGLIQIESTGVDDAPFNDTTARAKISFVRGDADMNDLEACPVADIEGQTIQYQYPIRRLFTNLPQWAFVPTSF